MVDNYISIKDLCAELIRKMGILIICTIISTVVITVVKYAADVRNEKTQINMEKEEVTIENIVESLSDEEKNALEYYVTQMKIYNQQEEYMEESIYFNLDANELCTANIQYFIDSETIEKTNNIIMMYNNYLTYGGLFAELCAVNEEWKPEYLTEIIKFACADISDYNYPSVINIQVYHQDSEQAAELVSQIKKALDAFRSDLLDTDLAHNLKVVEENILETSDSNMGYTQKDYINNHESLRKELETLKESLNEKQLFAAHMQLGTVTENTNNEGASEDELEENKVSINKKYVVLGAAAGFIFGIGIIVCSYIFTATIKTNDEIRILFNVPKLAAIELKEKKGFEKLANKIFYKNSTNVSNKELKLLVSKIINSDEIKEVTFAGEISEFAAEQVNEIISILAKHQMCAKYVKDICNDADDFMAVKNTGKVVFLETLRKSKNTEIYNKVALCKEQDIDILGYVVFDV